jgi:hypothetical protein
MESGVDQGCVGGSLSPAVAECFPMETRSLYQRMRMRTTAYRLCQLKSGGVLRLRGWAQWTLRGACGVSLTGSVLDRNNPKMWGIGRGGAVGAGPAGRAVGCSKLAAFAKSVLDPDGGTWCAKSVGWEAQKSNPPPGGEGLLYERRVTGLSILSFVCGRKSGVAAQYLNISELAGATKSAWWATEVCRLCLRT